MNKRLLITMTGTLLGMNAVFVNAPIEAKQKVAMVVTEEKPVTITTAEQFIDRYCSVLIDPATGQPIIDQATEIEKAIPQFAPAVNDKNYTVILEGNTQFLQLDKTLQDQIKALYAQKAEALKSDPKNIVGASTYDELVAQAAQLKTSIDQAAVNQQPGDPAQQPVDTTQQPVQPEQPVTDTNQQPADASQQPADPVQQPAEPENQPVEPTQPTDQQVPNNENKEQPASIEENAKQDENTIPITENTTGPSSNEAQPDPVDEPEINQQPAVQEPAVNEASELIAAKTLSIDPLSMVNPKIDEPVASQPEKKEEQPQSLIAALSHTSEENTEPKEIAAVDTTSSVQETVVPQAAQTTNESSLSSAAEEFIRTYASENGATYKSATQMNYSKIISGLSSWNRLSREDKDKVNASLQQAGGKTYQKLLQEAQSIQFTSRNTLQIRQAPRINTASTTHAGLYGMLCGLAAAILGYLFTKRKEF